MEQQEIAERRAEAEKAGNGAVLSHVVNASHKLNVFKDLSTMPQSIDTFARRNGASITGVRRLFVALKGIGYLEEHDGLFSPTELGLKTTMMPPDFLKGKTGPLDPVWPYLAEAVIEGKPQMDKAFGNGEDIFSSLYKDPVLLENFCRFMLRFSLPVGEQIAEVFDRYVV